MADLRQAAQQALEAMEYADACLKKQLTTKTKHEYAQDWLLEAGTALRAALAEQPAEPVAVTAWEDKYGMKEWEVLALRAGLAPALPNQESDPCPQCKKGGVCRTPKCGRLNLPEDHPCRSAPKPAKRGLLTDEELALSLLETLFDAYENGVPCYDEDPETADGYIGHAFRLDDETFHACADLLNRRRPRAHGIGEPK